MEQVSKSRRMSMAVLGAALCLAVAGVGLHDFCWSQERLLEPSEAFQVAGRSLGPRVVEVRFRIAPGYSLYRDRITFATDRPGVHVEKVDLPAPTTKFEEALAKDVEIYRGTLVARVSVDDGRVPFKLAVSAQGCADVGVCYPPIHVVVQAGGNSNVAASGGTTTCGTAAGSVPPRC